MNRYHVERLGGASVEPGDPVHTNRWPDFHVCDEHGRTVAIFAAGLKWYDHSGKRMRWQRAADRAQEEADRLTALHACTVQLRGRHAAIVPPPPAPDDRPESADPGDPGDPDGDDPRADEERDRYYAGSETWKP